MGKRSRILRHPHGIFSFRTCPHDDLYHRHGWNQISTFGSFLRLKTRENAQYESVNGKENYYFAKF